MTTWTRATVDTICGGSREHCIIRPGEPMLVIELVSVKAKFYRCARCADRPVPPDLPADIAVSGKPARLPSMARLGLLPMDRVPGEEG